MARRDRQTQFPGSIMQWSQPLPCMQCLHHPARAHFPDFPLRRAPPMTANTIAANQQMDTFDGHQSVWLFGYGSLIYKTDFPYLERRPASIANWTRRFW